MSAKQFLGTCITATAVLTLGSIIQIEPASAQSITFECQPDNNQVPTTYAVTPDGSKPVIKWQSDFFAQSSWTPMKRCQTVTERFNSFNSQNMMNDVTSGWVNRQPVVCATLNCSNETLLFTLRPEQNPEQVLQEIFANRQGASTPTVQCSGCNASVNLQNYLDQTPVEIPGTSASSTPSTVQPNSESNSDSNSNGGVTW